MMGDTEKTILYVDDDADDRDLLLMVMQKLKAGSKLAFAENGLEAMNSLAARKRLGTLPCLVILDLNMPFLNGKETFLRIKDDPDLSEIPIIIFSSGRNPVDVSFFKHEGVEMLMKPIDGASMESIATKFLGICRSST